jgi:hypothetical protein
MCHNIQKRPENKINEEDYCPTTQQFFMTSTEVAVNTLLLITKKICRLEKKVS